MKPTITSIRRKGGIAGQVQYTATVRFEGEFAAATTDATFVGNVYGTPGPVQIIVGELGPIHVHDAGRFGDTFDELWVRRFYAEGED